MYFFGALAVSQVFDPEYKLSLRRLTTDVGRLLFVPVHYSAAGQVIRGKLNHHPVTRKDPDEIHPDLPRNVRQNLVTVLQLYAEHRVWQRFDHCSLNLNYVLF